MCLKELIKMNTIPVIDMAATGRRINDLRKKAGIPVKTLQDILGFNTPQAIYKWMNGTSMPTVDNLVILAAVLHVTIDGSSEGRALARRAKRRWFDSSPIH